MISSERGNYYALISYSNFLPTQLQVTAVSVYDRSGKLMWSKEGPGCNAFIMCDTAPLLVGIEGAEGFPESRLIFFNSSGEKVGNAKVQNFYNGQFCESGEFFFGISGAGNLSKIQQYRQTSHDFGHAIRYHSSFDGKVIAVVSDCVTTFIPIRTLSPPGRFLTDRCAKSDSRTTTHMSPHYTAIASMSLILPPTASLAEHTLDDSAFRFFRFDADPNFNFFVCGAEQLRRFTRISKHQGSNNAPWCRGQLTMG